MKKYIFDFDKKVKMYLYIYLGISIISGISPLFMMNEVDYGYTRFNAIIQHSILPLTIVMLISMLYLIYLYFMDVTFTCTLKDSFMKVGTLPIKKLHYTDIDSISFGKHIMLFIRGKKTKIRVINFEANRDKYFDMISEIKEKAQLDFSVEEAMAQLSYINNYEFAEEGKALRLNSWLLVAYVNLIIVLSLLGLYFVLSMLTVLFAFNWSLLVILMIVSVMFIFFLVVAIFIGKRHKKAPTLIKVIIISTLVLYLASITYSLISESNLVYGVSQYLSLISALIIFGVFTLTILRCINKSKMVKHTFVYDKFQKVINYDRSVDPGFKLFAYEGASIYGVLSWIVAPILYVILFVLIIVSVIAGGLM